MQSSFPSLDSLSILNATDAALENMHSAVKPSDPPTHRSQQARVVAHIQSMIERGELRMGDRLPPERELSSQLKISRSSIRAGIQSLAALGVLHVKPGTGTYVTDGKNAFDGTPLGLFADLHGFTTKQIFEARLILERTIASLAALRANEHQLASMAEGIVEMYASLEDPRTFQVHDVCFHRDLSEAAGNVILTTLLEIVAAVNYQRRRESIDQAQDLKKAASLHREIYRAVRAHEPEQAAAAMEKHLRDAEQQISEEEGHPTETTTGDQEIRD